MSRPTLGDGRGPACPALDADLMSLRLAQLNVLAPMEDTDAVAVDRRQDTDRMCGAIGELVGPCAAGLSE